MFHSVDSMEKEIFPNKSARKSFSKILCKKKAQKKRSGSKFAPSIEFALYAKRVSLFILARSRGLW